MAGESPRVSVIIATYNWSSVLRYSIKSALWQSISDIEVLVVGDGCTDDSEQVALSFNDLRVRWHNLPENSGNQWKPNNKGLELARAPYVAYLGHDDIWHPQHLEILVNALEATEADAVFSIAEVINPHLPVPRDLQGVAPTGKYEHNMAVSPSTLLHRVSMIRDIGGWKDYRLLRRPIDVEFMARAWEHQKKIVPVHELTVFKFPSATREKSYIEKPSHEQVDYTHRLETDPELRYHELMQLICQPEFARKLFDHHYAPNEVPQPGAIIESWRAVRGLSAKPELSQNSLPIYQDTALLRDLNAPADISGYQDRVAFFRHQRLPEDGLLVGFGWYGLERDEWGRGFRWANNDAEIVVTRPSGMPKTLQIELAPGPGVDYQPFQLVLLDETGSQVATALVKDEAIVELPLTVPAGEGAVFRLHINEGGRQNENDPRILNFRVWRFEWADDGLIARQTPDKEQHQSVDQFSGSDDLTKLKTQVALLQAQRDATRKNLQPLEAELEARRTLITQLDSFRSTSFGYWWHRVRTSPKLRRWLRRG